MDSQRPIWFAIFGNVAVAAIAFAVLGWNSAAAHAAARYTARFSMAWFVAAFAAPGLARWIRAWPRESRLVQAFVGGHLVHFADVAVVLTVFDSAHLARFPLQAAIVVTGGFGLILTLGLTAGRWTSRAGRVVNQVALYLVFLIFLAAYAYHPNWPLRWLTAPIGLGLVLRLMGGSARGKEPDRPNTAPSADFA